MNKLVKNRLLLLVTLLLTTTFLVLINSKAKNNETQGILVKYIRNDNNAARKNWRELSLNETRKFSKLGGILFEELDPPLVRNPNKTYEILVWKYGKTIENRHLKNFGTERVDPFAECSVKNCRITYEDSALKSADLVIFHMHRMKKGDLPASRGSNQQIWAFLTDESPYNTFLSSQNISSYNGVFNWSMTYRMDADIPVPYGRTVLRRDPLREEELVIRKRRDVLVAILGSNCGGNNKRWDYVEELQKHIRVDVYGGCGPLKCPGHFKADCPVIKEYLFYLAFENSNCDEYITEKLWWNAFAKNAIPIVMGASQSSYRKVLPPGSYLNVDDYAHPEDLATYVLYLNRTEKYLDYFQWKAQFQILNEHGYFQSKSYHYCRACEALNYNERSAKVYGDLEKFWSRSRDCHPAWNA